jgi:hypothetical protein
VHVVQQHLNPTSDDLSTTRLVPDHPIAQRGITHIKCTNLSLLHNPLGHQALCTLLAADKHGVWADTKICMEPETDYITCKIATIRAIHKSCNRFHGHNSM